MGGKAMIPATEPFTGKPALRDRHQADAFTDSGQHRWGRNVKRDESLWSAMKQAPEPKKDGLLDAVVWPTENEDGR